MKSTGKVIVKTAVAAAVAASYMQQSAECATQLYPLTNDENLSQDNVAEESFSEDASAKEAPEKDGAVEDIASESSAAESISAPESEEALGELSIQEKQAQEAKNRDLESQNEKTKDSLDSKIYCEIRLLKVIKLGKSDGDHLPSGTFAYAPAAGECINVRYIERVGDEVGYRDVGELCLDAEGKAVAELDRDGYFFFVNDAPAPYYSQVKQGGTITLYLYRDRLMDAEEYSWLLTDCMLEDELNSLLAARRLEAAQESIREMSEENVRLTDMLDLAEAQAIHDTERETEKNTLVSESNSSSNVNDVKMAEASDSPLQFSEKTGYQENIEKESPNKAAAILPRLWLSLGGFFTTAFAITSKLCKRCEKKEKIERA